MTCECNQLNCEACFDAFLGDHGDEAASLRRELAESRAEAARLTVERDELTTELRLSVDTLQRVWTERDRLRLAPEVVATIRRDLASPARRGGCDQQRCDALSALNAAYPAGGE